MQGLEDTTITTEAKYSINFSRPQLKSCLSLHYNGSNSFLFFYATNIYQLKAERSEVQKSNLLSLGNISKYFTANNMKKQDLMEMYSIFLLIIIF